MNLKGHPAFYRLQQGLAVGLIFICICAIQAVAIGQDLDQDAIKKSLAEVEKARASNSSRISGLEKELENSEADSDVEQSRLILRRVKTLDSTLSRYAAKLAALQDMRKEVSEATRELERLDSYEPDSEKPYSFLMLDSLYDARDLEKRNKKDFESELETAQPHLESTKQEMHRRAKTVEEARSEKSEKTSIDRLSELKDESAIAKAKYEANKVDVELLKLRIDKSKVTQKQLDKKIAVVRKHAKFSSDDLEEKSLKLDSTISRWKADQSIVEAQLARLYEFESRPTSPDHESILKSMRPSISQRSEKLQFLSDSIEQVMESLRKSKSFWKSRFELATDSKISIQALRKNRSELRSFLEHLESLKSNFVLKIGRRETLLSEPISNAPTPDNDETASIANILHEIDLLFESTDIKIRDQIDSVEFPMSRYHDELREKIKAASSIWEVGIIEFVQNVLNYEVTEVDDEPVTIWSAVFLILLILAGVYFSFVASHFVASTIFPKLGIKPGVAIALRSIFRYALCIFFGVLAFRLLNIPLTAFAFLGGAAAIAVGFGSQDVMNNFMSGLILLTEQPIRVGDVIVLNDAQCLVTHIGLRSTRLRNYQKHELIVPNTMLIEKLVTNLTLSDNLLRLVVSIEVDRTEPVQDSMQKISHTLKTTALIHNESEPVVLLKVADTYYLTFEVHFTIKFTDPMESLIAQSKILEAICVHFPSKSDPEAKDENSNPDDSSSRITPVVDQVDPHKLDKTQLEREVKRLRSEVRSKSK